MLDHLPGTPCVDELSSSYKMKLLSLSLVIFRKNMKQKGSEELVPGKRVAEHLLRAREMLAVLLQGAGDPE